MIARPLAGRQGDHKMKRTMIATALILGGMLNAAQADTWVFKDMQRPNGHDRSMAAKRADGRKCGALPGGRAFKDADAPNMRECMFARGWALDHIIPDPPSAHARAGGSDSDHSPPIDNSSNDDMVRSQQDQDNLQQTINNQQMINDQQMLNDQMFQQQQQQIINNQ
jgi:hypothetical protein